MVFLIINLIFITAFAAYEKIRGSEDYSVTIIILFVYGVGCVGAALMGDAVADLCAATITTVANLFGKASAVIKNAAGFGGLSDIGGIATNVLPQMERKSKAAFILSFTIISSTITAVFSGFGISGAKYCAEHFFGEEIGSVAKAVIIYDSLMATLSFCFSVAEAMAA